MLVLDPQCSITPSSTGTNTRGMEQVVNNGSCLNCDPLQKKLRTQETTVQGLNHPLVVPTSLL